MRSNSLTEVILRMAFVGLIASAAAAQAQPLPSAASAPGMAPRAMPPMFLRPGSPEWRASLPVLQHEKTPDSWPQPDYLVQAMAMTPARPGERVRAVSVNPAAATTASYISLPVQTQAFGFSRPFLALVGAELDWLMASAGVKATNQTDIADVSGPFVRRLDDEVISELARLHASKKLIGLYLGHDGVHQAFLTLVVLDGKTTLRSHKTIELPDQAPLALAAISKTLPELLSGVGFPVQAATRPSERSDFRCAFATWDLADTPSTATPGQRACDALAVGTLLPTYGPRSWGSSHQMSPAKLAWLAKAHIVASKDLSSAETGAAIQELSFHQLDANPRDETPLAYVNSTDPVTSRVARLLSLRSRIANSPARSEQDARTRDVNLIAQDLPPYATRLVLERANLGEPFSQVDYCALDMAYPGGMPSAKCAESAAGSAKPSRRPSRAEQLLFQDWRIAYSYRELTYYAFTLGRPEKAGETLRAMPGDVGEHPFIRRLRYEFEESSRAAVPFDRQLQLARERVKNFLQATVDLPYQDGWYQGHSLSDHMWTDNMNILNDDQIRPLTAAEARLMAVMRFDRFAIDPPISLSRRSTGDPAYFLSSSIGDVQMGQMLARFPTPPAFPASSPIARIPAVPSAPYKPRLFRAHMDIFDTPSKEELKLRVGNAPQSLNARTELAVEMLKGGSSMAEALKVIDERPANQRTDNRISESHAWAEPAHAFYFAGEIDAARKYYARVAEIGTGSDSDMLARVRLPVIDGRLGDALRASQARMARYDNEFAWFDTVSLQFMTGQAERAWPLFVKQAAGAKYLMVWNAALTGHRMQGIDLRGAKDWLASNKLEQVQIESTDVSILYLHLLAVLDRVPSDDDIAVLREKRGQWNYVDEKWGASALLIRSALENNGLKEAYAHVVSKVHDDANDRHKFMLPLFAWVAWQATEGKDESLDQIRQASLRWSFDDILAKSMVLALEKQTDESLKFFRAARFEQSGLGGGDTKLVQRAIPASYQYALAGYLMYKKTGVEAYREDTLRFVRSYQSVFPQFSWLYSMEALLEHDRKKQLAAACRARFLDPRSYFLKLAGLESAKVSVCPAHPW